jgi:hypothetical protein
VYPIGTGNTTQLFTPKTAIGTVKIKAMLSRENLIYASVRVNSGLAINSNVHAGGLAKIVL